MVCSQCKQEGHKKPTCKNPVFVPVNSEPKVKPEPNAKSEPEHTPIEIQLPDEIKSKMAKLGQLCNMVASGLGKGYVEGVYQQALCIELQDVGLRYVSEETMPIVYKGQPVGGGHSQRLDIVVLSHPGFIFELKAVSKPISSEHHWQLVRYLDYKKLSYGAVVNFNQSDKGSLEVQFIVKQDEVFYIYDLESGSGSELSDFSLVKTADEWGWE